MRACGFWESGVKLCGTCQGGWACAWFFHCSCLWSLTFPRPFFLAAIEVVAPVPDPHHLPWKRYSRQSLLGPCWAGRVSDWRIEKRRDNCYLFSVVVLPTNFRSSSFTCHLLPGSWASLLQTCLVAWMSTGRVLYGWTQQWHVNWLSWRAYEKKLLLNHLFWALGLCKWSVYGKESDAFLFGYPPGPGIKLIGTRLLKRNHTLLLPKRFHTSWLVHHPHLHQGVQHLFST